MLQTSEGRQGEFRVGSKVSVPSSACRGAVGRWLRDVLPALTVLCLAALPAAARDAARELNPTVSRADSRNLRFQCRCELEPGASTDRHCPRDSCAVCGELHNRTGIFMLKLIRSAHDMAFEEADQPAEQGLNQMDNAVNLAQIKAELSYLNRLDEIRETNVASLKRLKEARDALLGRGGEVAGISTSRRV